MAKPLITTTITPTAEVVQKVGMIGPRVRVELRTSVLKLAIGMVAFVKEKKLSGQVLRNRTGTLRRSITHKMQEQPESIRATVGTNVSYARVHEFGWEGKVLIDQAFGRQLKYPVWKSVRLPERSFLRSSLKDKAEDIKKELRAAVRRGTTGSRS